MNAGFGLRFLTHTLVALTAVLAGGQVWVSTGSATYGWVAGFVTAGALNALSRPLIRRLSGVGRRMLGEYRGTIDEADFADAVDLVPGGGPRRAIQRRVGERPERVARSVRSLLLREGRSPSRGRKSAPDVPGTG